jgi:hypothetical protein
MVKQTSPFRSAVVALLILGMTAPVFAQAAVRPYAVVVDGTPSRLSSGYFNGAHTMLALENIGASLHLRVTRHGTTRVLHVGDDAFSFSPGNTNVLLGGDVVMQTIGPPEERNGLLFVTADDLQALLSESFAVNNTTLDVTTAAPAQYVHTAPLDHPRVSRYTVRSDSGSGGDGSARRARPRTAAFDATNALLIHAAISDSGGFRSRDLSFTTDGTRLRGSLDVAAFANSNPSLSGALAVGTRDRYINAGSESNPLGGLVFNAPGGYGASLHRPALAISVEHDSLGRTLVVLRRDRDNGATLVGTMRVNGSDALVAGDRQSVDGVVKMTRELWVSTGGAAASIDVATQGRFFGEAVASGTLGAFPLTLGEAPDRLNAGFRANDRMTLRAGVASGFGVGISPYLGVNFFGNHGLSGSVQLTGASRNAVLSYTGPQSSLSANFSSGAGGSSWGAVGSLAQRLLLWDFSAFRSGDNEDEVIRSHAATGFAPIIGLERIASASTRRIGPVLGVSVPLGRTTAFELTEHPIAAGRALAFGLTQRIGFAPRVPMRTLTLQNAATSLLYIDDRAAQHVDANVQRVLIAPGAHRIQARSLDGMQESLPITLDDNVSQANVELLPVRTVAGRVVQTDADPAGRKISLEHIAVRLEPGDLLVETDADGTFVFPAGPTAPNARVSIVRETLPDMLTVGDDAPADAVPLQLSVRTRVKIHHKKF